MNPGSANIDTDTPLQQAMDHIARQDDEIERLQDENDKLTTEATEAARILSALLEVDVPGMGPISKAIVMASVCRISELTEAEESAREEA